MNKKSPNAADSTPGFDQHALGDWQALAEKSLRGASLASLAHSTASGLSIEPLYVERPQAKTDLAPQPLQRWDNRLLVVGENASDQNKALLTGLSGGISSAQIQMISASTNIAISSEPLSLVLKDVQLDIVPISLQAGANFTAAAEQLESIWVAQNVPATSAHASFNADPIATLAQATENSFDLNSSLEKMNQLAIHTDKSFTNVTAVSVDSCCYHNAGASLEQELVASLATASLYMQSMLDAGLSAQSAHNNIVFQMACDADVLSNVVKLRALKILWHHVATHFDVTTPALQLVVETSLRMQSRLEPWVNHLRNVSAATAAAMGGAQSIVVHQHNRVDNEYLDKDSDASARVARNIAIILSEESAMTFIHDPMGGSYAVENLTNDLVHNSWQALIALEQNGGFVQSLTSGQWQQSIAQTQKLRVERLINEQDIQVAVNRYTTTAHTVDKPTYSPPDNANLLDAVREATAFEGSP